MTGVFVAAIVALLAVGYLMGRPVQGRFTVQVSPANAPVSPKSGTTFLHASDGSLTGLAITNDPNTWPGATPSYPNELLWNVCTAVARAEGFQQGVGTAPYDLNNPGDLSPGDEAGQAVCGQPQFHGGSEIILFCAVEDGFRALYRKFDNIVNGRSTVYPKTYTWAEVAEKYAGNNGVWLANVTNYLGVDMTSTPAEYVGV